MQDVEVEIVEGLNLFIVHTEGREYIYNISDEFELYSKILDNKSGFDVYSQEVQHYE
jgi:hypothetical protein